MRIVLTKKQDGHRGKCKFCCAESGLNITKKLTKKKLQKIKKDYYERKTNKLFQI